MLFSKCLSSLKYITELNVVHPENILLNYLNTVIKVKDKITLSLKNDSENNLMPDRYLYIL